MADVRTPELVINKLSKQQYENIQNPSDTEIYLVREDEEHKPICYPTTASEVTTSSMLVKSSVSDNGKMLTENGFVYNTSGNPTISDNKVICDLGVGFFEKKLENLTLNTEYHIKSYGQNASGLVYGSELVQRTTNNPIPVEYQLVEYLQSSGVQYIDTLHIPTSTDKIYIKWINTQTTNNYNQIVGARQGTFDGFTFAVSVQSREFIVDWFGGTQQTSRWVQTNVNSISTIELSIENNICSVTIDGLLYSNTFIPVSSINKNLYIFALNNNGAVSDLNLNGKCCRFKIENIMDLYPVYRIADNKPGMYDIVNNVFYTNQGTGEFTVGPDKEFDE